MCLSFGQHVPQLCNRLRFICDVLSIFLQVRFHGACVWSRCIPSNSRVDVFCSTGSAAAAASGFNFGNDLSDWLSVHPFSSAWNTTARYDVRTCFVICVCFSVLIDDVHRTLLFLGTQIPDTCTYDAYVARIPEACRVGMTGIEVDGVMEGLQSLLLSQGSLYADIARCPGTHKHEFVSCAPSDCMTTTPCQDYVHYTMLVCAVSFSRRIHGWFSVIWYCIPR